MTPWRPQASPLVRFVALRPPDIGWPLFIALAAISGLPLAIALATSLVRSPSVPPPLPAKVSYDRVPAAPVSVRTVSFLPQPSGAQAGADGADPVTVPPPRPSASSAASAMRMVRTVRTQKTRPSLDGLCARYGLRQVWYGRHWRCR